MDIATGQPEQHPTPLPLDASTHPAVVAPTAINPAGSLQGSVRDLTGERVQQLAAGEASAAAAMSAGMSADGDRRQHYQAAMTQQGPGQYGDSLLLPPVPANALPPASQPGLYPYSGDEPVSTG
jgi:hypothetical protein